jgi:hypothetical protein
VTDVPAKKTTATRAGSKTKTTTRKRRGPAEPRGPEAAATALTLDDESIAEVVQRIAKLKGTALAAYRDPYGGTSLVLASIPVASGSGPSRSWRRPIPRLRTASSRSTPRKRTTFATAASR